ncbi:hypothetical protein [Aeromicrobium sp. CF3.5]|uniref:hypothetical protein n=1 Tax=Aeromicrobium sp. CF3.5 TaxID=3373078 RepID=UPI003EE64A49
MTISADQARTDTIDQSLDVFRVSSGAAQRRILATMHRIDRSGVAVSAERLDDAHLIVVASDRLIDTVRAQRVVTSLDRGARRTHSVWRTRGWQAA